MIRMLELWVLQYYNAWMRCVLCTSDFSFDSCYQMQITLEKLKKAGQTDRQTTCLGNTALR